MKKRSKRFQNLQLNIKNKNYSVKEGLLLLKTFGTTKFVESVEAHISLNINPKYNNQQLREIISLPYGTGKKRCIAIFADESVDKKLLIEKGATFIGEEEMIENFISGKINFNVLLTQTQFLSRIVKYARYLGPKGLMPSHKSGTVCINLIDTLANFTNGQLEYKADKLGVVHFTFGKTTFLIDELEKNLKTIYLSIQKHKPSGVKGKYIKSFTVCTTMSPALKLDLVSFS